MRLTLLPVLVGSAVLLGAGYGFTVVLPATDAVTNDVTDATPRYSVAEAKGRGVYAGNGCVYCHTQQVRDTFTDAGLADRPTRPGDTLHDRPGSLGETRYGPDLACVGDRVPGTGESADEEARVDAMIAYLRDPASVHPGSTMPSYDHLGDDDLHRLAAYLVAQTCEGAK